MQKGLKKASKNELGKKCKKSVILILPPERSGQIHRVENKVENQVENKVEKRPPNKPPTKASGLRPEPNPQTGQHRRLSESCLSVIVDRTFCTAPIEDFGIIVSHYGHRRHPHCDCNSTCHRHSGQHPKS